MKKICIIALTLLFGMAQGAWADPVGSWASDCDATWGTDYSSSGEFTISTPAELAQFASMVNGGQDFNYKTVTLTADIDLSAHYWKPIGIGGPSNNIIFKGTFDGAGHTISHMCINEDNSYNGLFGRIGSDVKIRNLKITNSNISANSIITGAIVGYAESCRIENCLVDNTVYVTSTKVSDYGQTIATGGLVGQLNYGSANLEGCVSAANVEGTENVGGLVGYINSAHVTACLYTGNNVNGYSSPTQAALFGYFNTKNYLLYNLYTNSSLDGKNGEDTRGYVIYLHPQGGMTFDFGEPTTYSVSGISYYTYNNYPSTNYSCIEYGGRIYSSANQRIQFTLSAPIGYVPATVTASTVSASPLSIEDVVESRYKYKLYTDDLSTDAHIYATYELTAWDGEGAGTEGDPYLVRTANDLRWISVYVNGQNTDHYEGKYFQLANDIEFDDTENNYTPIGLNSNSSYYFAGIFDGQNHTISGINLQGNGHQGLFGTIGGATIKNLKLSACTITLTNNSSAGGIVAYIKKGATNTIIENCHVANNVCIDTQGYAGGIAGYVGSGNTQILGCTSAASIVLRNNGFDIGGIAGFCGYVYTDLEQTAYIIVSNCLYYGNSLTAAEGYSGRIGGIFGAYYSNVFHQLYSRIAFSNNYYTYPDTSVMGVGMETKVRGESLSDITSNLDITDDYAAVRVRAVSASADIADMGTADTPVVGGITPYTYGIKYADKYYSHVLALENDGDYTSALSDYEGQTFNVKLRGRTLYKDGSWNTICLPFDIPYFTSTIFLGADCDVCEMDQTKYYKAAESESYYYRTGCQDGRLYLFFRNVNSITAGVPYLVKWDKVDGYDGHHDPATYDHLEPMFVNVTINSSIPAAPTSVDGTVSFTPTYVPFIRDYEDRSVLFVSTANRLYYPNGAGPVSVKSFRAYFQLHGVQMAGYPSGDDEGDDDDDDYIPEGGGNVKPFIIDIEEDATSIQNPTGKGQQERETPFDLSGRKMAKGNLPKGIYIVNGKKVLF